MKSNNLKPLKNIVNTFVYINTLEDAFPFHKYCDLSNVDQEDIYHSLCYFIEDYINSNISSGTAVV